MRRLSQVAPRSYSSRKLDEVFELSDRVTILRDGRHITTCDMPTSQEQVIQMMVGQHVEIISQRAFRPRRGGLACQGLLGGRVPRYLSKCTAERSLGLPGW